MADQKEPPRPLPANDVALSDAERRGANENKSDAHTAIAEESGTDGDSDSSGGEGSRSGGSGGGSGSGSDSGNESGAESDGIELQPAKTTAPRQSYKQRRPPIPPEQLIRIDRSQTAELPLSTDAVPSLPAAAGLDTKSPLSSTTAAPPTSTDALVLPPPTTDISEEELLAAQAVVLGVPVSVVRGQQIFERYSKSDEPRTLWCRACCAVAVLIH